MYDYWDRRVMTPVMFTAVAFALAAVEWARRLVPQWPSPWLFTGLFVVCAGFTAWRFRLGVAVMKQRRQGMRGERIVGQMLEDLRYFDCKVYHDVCEDGYNIDHVIIGPHGVFSVETKAISKPEGDARVVFDGEHVTVAGFKPDRDPVAQSRACARRIRQILKEYSGVEPRVTPVVLYVGWYVEQRVPNPDTIVMNPIHFLQKFDRLRDPETLDAQQVAHLANNFERYLRSPN
jgi:hypothetical protein